MCDGPPIDVVAFRRMPAEHQRAAIVTMFESYVGAQYVTDFEGPWRYDDGSLQANGRGAPERHPRRCLARSKMSCERCSQWAMRGAEHCRYHGGRKELQPGYLKEKKDLSSRYSKCLLPTLARRLEDVAAEPGEDMELSSEVAIARSSLVHHLELLAAAEKMPKPDPAVTVDLEMLVRSDLKLVADLVSKGAAAKRAASDSVPLQALGAFVEQVTRVIHGVLGEEGAAHAERIAVALKEQVRLPGPGHEAFEGRVIKPSVVTVDFDT